MRGRLLLPDEEPPHSLAYKLIWLATAVSGFATGWGVGELIALF
jgi:hypothetical protein